MKYRILLSTLLTVLSAQAAVQPAQIFTDQAVLQRGETVRIWGTADPDERVTVRFNGQTASTNANSMGQWMAELEPMKVNAVGQDLRFEGSATVEPVVLKDVLVGEVWIAGGQSNMASTMFTYRKTTQADMNSANDPLLRFVTIPFKAYPEQRDKDFRWLNCTPENVKDFSATGFYFAKNLRESLDVPLGIISCNYGGTAAEAWMSREMLNSKPDLKRILNAYDQYAERSFANSEEYLAKVAQYEKDFAEYQKNRKHPDPSKRIKKPKAIIGPHDKNRPCGLYENMLARTIPYTVKGTIWYQGENNASGKRGYHYRSVFSALIEGWRQDFQNPEMPFLFVQLATLGWGAEPYWPELRESQKWVSEHVPNTGMAVLVDGGEKDNIHPHTKDKVGYRLALLARHEVYGERALVCRGPELKQVRINGNALELSFTEVGSGLVLKPEDGLAFEICGADGQYVPAKAELFDDVLRLTASGVEQPQHARYGWHTWFVPTLFNQEGLPASPFRTDENGWASEARYYFDESL